MKKILLMAALVLCGCQKQEPPKRSGRYYVVAITESGNHLSVVANLHPGAELSDKSIDAMNALIAKSETEKFLITNIIPLDR